MRIRFQPIKFEQVFLLLKVQFLSGVGGDEAIDEYIQYAHGANKRLSLSLTSIFRSLLEHLHASVGLVFTTLC